MSDEVEMCSPLREAEPGEVGGKRRNSELEEPRKRIRAGTLDEEKKRGKRLFGSLLGTLGGIKKDATSAKAQERAARQAEVEQRQKDRLQKASDEIAQRQAQANEIRRKRQEERDVIMEKERVEAVQEIKVLLARNLKTASSAGPGLYYMPWKLTPEQEARIDKQVEIAKQEQAEALKFLRSPQEVVQADDVDHDFDASTIAHESHPRETNDPDLIEAQEKPAAENRLSVSDKAVSAETTDSKMIETSESPLDKTESTKKVSHGVDRSMYDDPEVVNDVLDITLSLSNRLRASSSTADVIDAPETAANHDGSTTDNAQPEGESGFLEIQNTKSEGAPTDIEHVG